jgi:hypothetical protein
LWRELIAMLTAENGATMETDIEETPRGWVRYLIVNKDLGQLKPQRQVFPSKADAVAWLSAEATAHGFVYEPQV